jgi:DNA helicase-2/ATP-dependent DNA helicase PcrA
VETYTIHELIEDVLDETGYQKDLEAEGEIEYQTRLDNIEELINKAVSYEGEHEQPSLDEFLEEVALVADIDRMDESENRVTLMTLHSAKGLEFPRVYLSGMEDGLFPSMMSISSDDKEEVEEERRLCYVGITRAQKFLMLTAARQRMVNGETRYSRVSRFVEEIPVNLLDSSKLEPRLSFEKRAAENKRAGGKPAGISSFSPGNNAYASRSIKPMSNPGFGKTFTVQKADSLNYGKGDRVSHIKFGVGEVLEIKDGGRDFEVTVKFDNAGVKKMFASFAKLKLVKK